MTKFFVTLEINVILFYKLQLLLFSLIYYAKCQTHSLDLLQHEDDIVKHNYQYKMQMSSQKHYVLDNGL